MLLPGAPWSQSRPADSMLLKKAKWCDFVILTAESGSKARGIVRVLVMESRWSQKNATLGKWLPSFDQLPLFDFLYGCFFVRPTQQGHGTQSVVVEKKEFKDMPDCAVVLLKFRPIGGT